MKKGLWGFLVIFLGGCFPLAAEVAVLPATGVAGRTETYRIFVSDVAFPPAGKVIFEFGEAFSRVPLRSVQALTPDGPADGFTLDGFKIAGRTIEVDFKNRYAPFASSFVFELNKLQNPSRAQRFSAAIFVLNENGDTVVHASAPFSVVPDKLEKLSVIGPPDGTVRAGQLMELSARAEDRFGNAVDGAPVEWKISRDSEGSGTFLDNRFFATRAGKIEVAASSDGLESQPLLLNVVAGLLDTFEIIGTPESTVAGVPFAEPVNNVTVTAKDQFGNTVTDFSGTVSFSSDDPLAVLPVPYTFTIGGGQDNGRHTFPGSRFILKNAGEKRISVSSNGKTGSSPPVEVRANYLADFFFFAPPDVIAGKAFEVAVAGGVDLYGNPASGTVNVNPVSGGGASPSGAVPAFSSVVVVAGSGKSQQTLVATTPTVLRGSNGIFTTFSDTIQIRPAALGGFSLLLLPDTLSAGDSVATFSVEAKDRFGNLKTDFTGGGYFASSDSRASLQYPAGNPYSFTSGDAGRHTFPGSFVRFLTKGTQSLTFGDDSLRSPATSFLILPGPPVSFAVSAPANVLAGVPFDVSVQNAVDGFGNGVSLSVAIGLKAGSGISPSGDGPVLPTVAVVDGFGQGQVVLPKAEKNVLEGVSGALRFSSDTIAVAAAGLEKFEWNLGSPQTSGVPFSAPATLFAKDRFGNLKGNFDASSDSVVIAALPAGSWEGNVLKKPTDFVLGVTNLSALGVTFFGPANTYVFSATSSSGKTGASGPVEIRSIFVDSFSLAPSNIIRGQNFSVGFRITNQSPGPFVLEGVTLRAAGKMLPLPLPALPDTLASSGKNNYAANGSIPGDFPVGKFGVQLELSGRFGANFTTVFTPILDSLAVADSLFLRPSAEGLNFDGVSKSRLYPFAVTLVNQSNFDVVLDPATRLVFSRGGTSRSFFLANTTLLPRNEEGEVSFRPDSFPAALPSGTYLASLVLFGRRDGVSHADSFSLGDSIVLEEPARIYYASSSLSPTAVLLETPLNFRLRIGNNGQAIFQADTLSQLVLVHGSDSILGYLQPAVPIASGPPSELNFWVSRLPSPPPKGIFNWKPSVKLLGIENGLGIDTVLTLPDSVTLYPQPSLILDSLWGLTASPNRVNSDRSLPIRVRLFNPSAESLTATWLYLKENGTQVASLMVAYIAPQETAERNLVVPADSNKLGWVTYEVEVVAGYGTVSSAPAELTLKMNQVTIQRQRKAILELSPEIVAPPSARGGILPVGQTMTLAVTLGNLGEAPVGTGQVRFKVAPPILTFISDSTAAVSATQPAVFQLLAQDTVDSGRIVASWSQIPNDSNTASPAEVFSDSVELSFRIIPARIALTISAVEKPTPLLYAGESVTPFEFNFANLDVSGSHHFLVKKVSIGVSGLKAPADLSAFQSAVLSSGGNAAPATVEDDHLSFEFSPPVLIGPEETRTLELTVRPEERISQSLRFYSNSTLIEAFDSVSGAPPVPALLLKANGEPFDYSSSVFTTASGAGLAASLVTYPNPFSPPAERIQISYRLSAASEVELKIYTLAGELVMERTYASGAGVNQIEWDGCNGKGEMVKNGVYLAVIRSEATGETVKQKLAVVK